MNNTRPLVGILVALCTLAPMALGFDGRTNRTDEGREGPTFDLNDTVQVMLPDPNDTLAPAEPPGGLGRADPWLDAQGDELFGDLDVGLNKLEFGGGDLLSLAPGELLFGGNRVCIQNVICDATVRQVSSGAGLTGGPITVEGTLSIADAGVVTGMIANAAVTEAKLGFDPATQAELDAYVPDWVDLTNVPSGFADGVDDDTTYVAGAGLVLAGNEFGADATYLQRRVAGACLSGTSIQAISPTGSVVCNTFVANADRLDNVDSASFLRSDASDSYTAGTMTFDPLTVLNVNGDVRIGMDGGVDDDIVGFDTLVPSFPFGTLAPSETLMWDDSEGAFAFSDDLILNNARLQAACSGACAGVAYSRFGNGGTLDPAFNAAHDLLVSGSVKAVEGLSTDATNLFINANGGEATQQICFFEDALACGEGLVWQDVGDRFALSDDLVVSGTVSAAAKLFIADHPLDPTKVLAYMTLEGPEAGIYWRTSGQLVDGEARVDFPEVYSLILSHTEPVTATVSLTSDANGVFVAEKALDHVVVRETGGGTSDATFDVVIWGLRAGYEDHEVVQDRLGW